MNSYKLYYHSKYKKEIFPVKQKLKTKKFIRKASFKKVRVDGVKEKKVQDKDVLFVSLPLCIFLLSIIFYFKPLFTDTQDTNLGKIPYIESYSQGSETILVNKEELFENSEFENEVIALKDIDDVVTTEGEEVLTRESKSPYRLKTPSSAQIKKYKVRKGDTIWGVAKKFSIKVDTLITKNQLNPTRKLKLGITLIIPPDDGVFYRVKSRDTLAHIANRYNIPMGEIRKHNRLTKVLSINQELFLPGAILPNAEKELLFGGFFVKPVSGVLTSSYGMRIHPIKKIRLFHTGIDIGGNQGQKIQAARGGKIIYSGRKGNYGQYVKIRHDLGYETGYGHLKKVLVKKGQIVRRGEFIGVVGSTGLSTGPHLHFEVKQNGKYINPSRFMKISRRRT